MFPMPALRRKTAGAFVMLIWASSAGPMAAPGLAQDAGTSGGGQPGSPPAIKPDPAPAPSGQAPSVVPLTAPAPSQAPVAKPAVTPLPGMQPAAGTPGGPPAAGKVAPKLVPKPGPGKNDAGQAATGLRTVKLSAVGLIDRSVIGREKREIGHVIDVLVDAKGEPAALVVDVGGFMGMGNRRIAIAWERFALAGRKPKDALQLPLSDAQVKAAPAYDGSQSVTVVQDSIEPPARPSAARSSLGSSRVDLGEGLTPSPDQTPDPLNPD